MKVKAKKITKRTLPDGGCYVMSKNMDFPKTITYLDALEEDCWELFKSYAELAGVIFDEDSDTNFYIAKEIQEKIISLVEENLKVGFPIIGTNENGTFCKIKERVFIDTEWEFGLMTSVDEIDDITIAKIEKKLYNGETSGCINGIEWNIGFSVTDKNAFASKEFCDMMADSVKRGECSGEYKGFQNIDYYIINGEKYSSMDIFKASINTDDPLKLAIGFKAALADIKNK